MSGQLFLVKWPNRNISLVKAADRQEVVSKLDEFSNSQLFQISVYHGPVELDFRCHETHGYFKSSENIHIRKNEILKTEKSPFSQYFNSKEFSDFEVICGSKIIPCHKIVLSNCLFFKEKLETSSLKTNETSYEILLTILYFIYNGELKSFAEKNTFEFWFDVFKISSSFQLLKLNDLCQKELIKCYEKSEMNLSQKLNILTDENNPYLEIMESYVKERMKKDFTEKLGKIIPLINQAYALKMMKFIDFLLNEVAQKTKFQSSELVDLNPDLKVKYETCKVSEAVSFNTDVIELLKEQFPFHFELTHDLSTQDSQEMWKSIYRLASPKLAKVMNGKKKNSEQTIKKVILEEEKPI
eukprot:gene9752-2079_t